MRSRFSGCSACSAGSSKHLWGVAMACPGQNIAWGCSPLPPTHPPDEVSVAMHSCLPAFCHRVPTGFVAAWPLMETPVTSLIFKICSGWFNSDLHRQSTPPVPPCVLTSLLQEGSNLSTAISFRSCRSLPLYGSHTLHSRDCAKYSMITKLSLPKLRVHVLEMRQPWFALLTISMSVARISKINRVKGALPD